MFRVTSDGQQSVTVWHVAITWTMHCRWIDVDWRIHSANESRSNERTNGKQRTSPMIIYCISLTYWIVVHWWQKQLSQWGDVLFFVSSRTPLTSSSSSSPVGTHRKCRWTNSLRSRTSRQIARSLRRNKDRSTYTTGESTRRNERYFDNPRLYCSTSETSSV